MKNSLTASKSGGGMRQVGQHVADRRESKREDAVTDSRVSRYPAVSHSIFPLAFPANPPCADPLPHSSARFRCVQTYFHFGYFNQHFPNFNKIKILNLINKFKIKFHFTYYIEFAVIAAMARTKLTA